MKYIFYVLIAIALLVSGCQNQKESQTHEHDSEAKADVPGDTLKKSIPKVEHTQIGETHFTIKYHAPSVRGRTIWGGLVPYGEVWVTGAHSATSIEFSKDITVNGTKISAGKYAFFSIPGKDKWTIIINRNWDQHLADEYDSKDDVVRVEVIPETSTTLQERLKYSVTDDRNSSASLNVSWEKVKISLPIQLN